MLRSANRVAWIVASAALWIYMQTLSPTVAWRNSGEDSGDLLVASATLGIAHPTGYPLFVLLGRIASLLPLGSLAFRINLISALAGAAGIYFLARCVLEVARANGASTGAAMGAVAASLLYAFSAGAWSQSVIAEVYTLNVAILGAVLWAIARAGASASSRPLLLAAFLFGLGLSNHLLILAAVPALSIATLRCVTSRSIGRTGIVLLLLFAFWGATLDLYLPIRATNGPEFSWGAPSTPDQLAWVLTGAQYTRNFFGRTGLDIAHYLVPGRWVHDFGWALLFIALGVVGLVLGRAGGGVRKALPLVASLGGTIALLAAYTLEDDVGYWMPAGYVACALAGIGVAALWSSARSRWFLRVGLVVLIAGFTALSLVRNYRAVDASQDFAPYVYAHRNLEVVEPNALILSEYDGRTFALWFYKATDFKRSHPDLVVAYKYLLVWPWYQRHLAKQYRGLNIPPYSGDLDAMMNRVIASNIRRRPVYLVRNDPGIASVFQTEPVGYPTIPLYRVSLRPL